MTGLPRRSFLRAGGLAAGVALSPSLVWAAVRDGGAAGKSEQAFLATLCDLLIPDTDTPGARAADVPSFVVLALRHGLDHARGDEAVRLQAELDAEAGGGFLQRPPAVQEKLLAALDAASFRGGAVVGSSAWPKIKSLILMGYYTSEAGGAQELRYEPVPGRFDPDIPCRPDERAISNDWKGVIFR
jgi:hypothetical protein